MSELSAAVSVLEPARHTPIAGTHDVIVCGGGPAGVSAAVYAARLGARVLLIELGGCLGGVWTAGLLSYVLDCGNKSGLNAELQRRLAAITGGDLRRDLSYDGLPWVSGSYYYDAEAMKLALERICLEEGVRIQLHTRVVGAIRDASNGAHAAITESNSGRQAWRATVFVDATGDGDLAALAGCGFDLGRDDNGETQPMSLLCLLAGVDAREAQPFLTGQPNERGQAQARLLAEMRRAGVAPSYGRPLLAQVSDHLLVLMANHEYDTPAQDAARVTQATLRARAEVHHIVDALRALGGPWRRARIAATAAHIGVREGRRIHGRYRITREDLIAGAVQPDAVCRVTFPVDVHATRRGDGAGYSDEGIRSRPYDVPLRALIARDVEGMLMAGRCISGDFWAHASYRVTGNAVAMGEAAGALAAIAARAGCRPAEVPFGEVAAALTEARRA